MKTEVEVTALSTFDLLLLRHEVRARPEPDREFMAVIDEELKRRFLAKATAAARGKEE